MDKVTRKEIGMDINQKITEELGVKKWQVDAAVTLIDEGNTIPFIARYRKEATGTLDDEQLRKLHEDVYKRQQPERESNIKKYSTRRHEYEYNDQKLRRCG